MNESKLIKDFEEARANRMRAEEYIDLLKCRDYPSGGSFKVSPYHGMVKVVIAGQKQHCGQNYWDSPDKFNEVLRQIIVDRFAELAAEVVVRLRAKEEEARLAARPALEAALAAVNEAA